MKNHFPFRIGTTSYVLNDEVLANIHFLKGKVDHVQLFVYETGELSVSHTDRLLKELNWLAAEYDLTYSVHLPIGLKLGSPDTEERNTGVSTVLRAIEATHALKPLVWDLHLEQNYQGEILGEAWQESCVMSLEKLKSCGVDPSRVGIETLEFDYKPILNILDQTGFSVTLDIGHVWFNALNEAFYFDKIFPRAISFHIHGFNNLHDHKGLHTIDESRIRRFLEVLYTRHDVQKLPVSIEVFSQDCLERSLETLYANDLKIQTS